MMEYRTGVEGGTLAVRVETDVSKFPIDFAGPSEMVRVLCGRILDADEGRDLAMVLSVGTFAFWIGTLSRVVGAETTPLVELPKPFLGAKVAVLSEATFRLSSIFLVTFSSLTSIGIPEDAGPEWGSVVADAEALGPARSTIRLGAVEFNNGVLARERPDVWRGAR